MRVANKVGYAWGVRIECRLRTIVYSHIIRHSRIQCQRGISNWPLWLKTHCSTRTKNCHAEAAIRVKPSPKHLLQYQVPEHNRTGNPRFSIHTYIHIHMHTNTGEVFGQLFPTLPSNDSSVNVAKSRGVATRGAISSGWGEDFEPEQPGHVFSTVRGARL